MEGDSAQRRAMDRGMAAVAAAGLGLVVYLTVALTRGGGDAPMNGAGDPASAVTGQAREANAEPRSGVGPNLLSGTVADAAGQPVAAVTVTAVPESTSASGSASVSDSASASGSPSAVIGRTDPTGAFSLVGLAAGSHRIRVDGSEILAAEVRFVDVPGPAVRILVSRRARVGGRVTEHGRPVAHAAVHLLPLGGAAPLARDTDADGRFAFDDLPEGRFRLWAGLGDRASPAQPVDRVGPGPFDDLALALVPAAIVTGRVVDGTTGRGVASHVSLVADDPEEPPRAATSSAEGSFRIEGVPLGRWTADAFAPGYVSAEAVRFQTGTDQVPAIALRRGGVLAGRVVDSRGAPVVGALVLARAEGGGADVSAETVARGVGVAAPWGSGQWAASRGGLVTATGLHFIPRGELGVLVGPLPFAGGATDATGAVRIASSIAARGSSEPDPPALPVDPALAPRFTTDREGRFRVTGLPPGRYRVIAAHPDFADGASPPRAIDLDRADDGVEVVMRAGVLVHGIVTDERGAAIAGATVEARGEQGGPDPRFTVTGPDGHYRLGRLAADVRLEVSAPGHGGVSRELAVGRAGTAQAVREENFTLVQADAAIEGRVTDASGFAVQGASVRAAGDERAAAQRAGSPAVTDAAGRFRLTGLVGGRHRLHIEHPDYPPAELEAATGTGVELRIPFGGGVAVDVRDRSGGAPVAGAAVVARGPGGEQMRAAAGRDGRVELARLAPGTWTVEASARGYAGGELAVQVAAGARPRQLTAPPVRLELSRGAILAGVVRDHDGERVAGAAVAVGRASTTSDEQGRFRLTEVASGAVTVEAQKGEARGALALDLAPGDELVTLELRME